MSLRCLALSLLLAVCCPPCFTDAAPAEREPQADLGTTALREELRRLHMENAQLRLRLEASEAARARLEARLEALERSKTPAQPTTQPTTQVNADLRDDERIELDVKPRKPAEPAPSVKPAPQPPAKAPAKPGAVDPRLAPIVQQVETQLRHRIITVKTTPQANEVYLDAGGWRLNNEDTRTELLGMWALYFHAKGQWTGKLSVLGKDGEGELGHLVDRDGRRALWVGDRR
jgi:hypothetical protein